MDLYNPAGQTGAAAEQYIASLFQLLGDRNPLDVLAELVPAIEKAIAGVPDAKLRQPERPGKWSINEVVQHLADSDLVFGYRVRMVVAQPTTAIQAYDQDRWSRELSYGNRKIEDALATLRALRVSNVRLLRSLTPEELERYGMHAERGKESVSKMMKLFAGHDLAHRRQIDRIKAAIKV